MLYLVKDDNKIDSMGTFGKSEDSLLNDYTRNLLVPSVACAKIFLIELERKLIAEIEHAEENLSFIKKIIFLNKFTLKKNEIRNILQEYESIAHAQNYIKDVLSDILISNAIALSGKGQSTMIITINDRFIYQIESTIEKKFNIKQGFEGFLDELYNYIKDNIVAINSLNGLFRLVYNEEKNEIALILRQEGS